MAAPHPSIAPTPNRTALRCIFLTIIGFLVLLGLVALIVWLIVRPAAIQYTVEDAHVRDYNLTSSNALNATFDLKISADNHNHRVSMYYDSIEVSVWYADQMVAYADASPFYQPKRNVTSLDVSPEGRAVMLPGSVAARLKRERTGGKAEFEVRVKARIRFKVGVIKSRHYTMRVYCSPVELSFPSSKTFNRVYCDVDI